MLIIITAVVVIGITIAIAAAMVLVNLITLLDIIRAMLLMNITY